MIKDEFWGVIIGIVVFAVLGFGVYAAWGQLAYGDWTCGFKRCVQVQNRGDK